MAVIAHWKLNDNAASATVIDDRGAYNGTYKDVGGNENTSNGSVASGSGVGTALDFDKANSEYIDTGNTFQSIFQSSFSISIWAKPDDGQPTNSGYFFGISTNAEEDCVWMILTNTGSLHFQYSSNGNRARLYVNGGNPLFSDGQEIWHHLVMTVDSKIRGIGGVNGYFDSQLMPVGALSKGDTSGVTFGDFASTLNPFLGAENTPTGAANYYDGLIDNVMLFDTTLNPDQVLALYNGGHGTEIAASTDESRRIKRRQ